MTKDIFRNRCKKLLNRKNRYILKKNVAQSLLKILSKNKYKKILLYISMDREVDTKQLIIKLRRQNKEIFVPFMEELSFKMVKYSLPLKKKNFNIYEPKNKNKTKKKIDIAVVPIIGIDKKFKRVGFGKGMYDRFFDKLKYKPEIIFTQIYPCVTKNVVTDKYDIKANSYVTYNLVCERRIIDDNRDVSRCRNRRSGRFFSFKKN